MSVYGDLKKLRDTAGNSYWQNRIAAQLLFLFNLSDRQGLCLEESLAPVLSHLLRVMCEKGALVRDDIVFAEESLSEFSPLAKEYTAHLVAHAHIDMNWMWGYPETVSATLDTMRTMLDFMDEYPDFTFSQSQASVYEIVDKYDPLMLERIKERVKEGRWEVTAGTWVEHDKNLAGTEAQVRQITEARKYLSGLLEIDGDSLCIDFEPDTFGHPENTPEILSHCGIKYYYHCRGNCDNVVYNWEAPSGKKILVYRDPKWYNDGIDPYILSFMPCIVCDLGIKDMINVYGVGDHGGGPTRKDIEAILDMKEWPLYPEMEFSTYKTFFEAIEPYRDNFDTVKGEQNFIFSGCYTSQSKIKKANSILESHLYDSECLSALSHIVLGKDSPHIDLSDEWRGALFNQFHDILPGSGVAKTVEHAMGTFQNSLAGTDAAINRAVRFVSDVIDTSGVVTEKSEFSTSEGAGAGYYSSHNTGYVAGSAERGQGDTRIVQLFNTTATERKEVHKIVLFDYDADLSDIVAKDSRGAIIPFVIGETRNHFWQHYATEIYVFVTVPPMGYETVVFEKNADKEKSFSFPEGPNPRIYSFGDCPRVLENDLIRATFEPCTYALISLFDKKRNIELCGGIIGEFELSYETLRRGESSWTVGQYMQKKSLNREYKTKFLDFYSNDLLTVLRYAVFFEKSEMEVTLTLKKGSSVIETDVRLDWLEASVRPESIPSVRFSLKAENAPVRYTYGTPMGECDRKPICYDVPAIKYAFADGLSIICPEKYGYRGYMGELSVNLIRSSCDPDPYPDIGRHDIKFYFGASRCPEESAVLAEKLSHPLIAVSAKSHKGILPLSGSLLTVEGARVSCVKTAESGKGIVVRLYNPEDEEKEVRIGAYAEIEKACLCDGNEKEFCSLTVEKDVVAARIGKRVMTAIKLEFSQKDY